MAVDQFLSRWRGFRGSISRAFVPVGSIPVIEVRRKITNVENYCAAFLSRARG